MTYTKDYPRPDFQRVSFTWQSLEGVWDFLFDDDDAGLEQAWHQGGLPDEVCSTNAGKTYKKRAIQVPFAFQTAASGIGETGVHEVLWYERVVHDMRNDYERENGHRLVLRFGAVDYEATVWVEGRLMGSHRGGHVPFDVDVTDACACVGSKSAQPLRLTVRVYDSSSDLTQPRGKQYWKPESAFIFYRPTSGIWQSVWLESVPRMRIVDGSRGTVMRSDDVDGGLLRSTIAVAGRPVACKAAVEVEVSLGDVVVGKERADLPRDKDWVCVDTNVRLSAEKQLRLPATVLEAAPVDDSTCWHAGVALWSPSNPTLYDVTLRLFDRDNNLVDVVRTYAGMRRISWTTGDRTFRLNGKPYFQILTLDQGYWPDTGLTPPSQESLKRDVQLAKRMGFNGCRKHQKVEDPLFLYWADKLGYLVWGEMANAFEFSREYVERFNQEWIESVKRDINHPCVVTWTPVNETWAYPDINTSLEQRNHIRSLYYMTKTLDPTRPVNDNCGWEHVATDLTTFHDYADAPELERTCMTMQGILTAREAALIGPADLGPLVQRHIFVPPIHDSLQVDPPCEIDPRCEIKPGAPIICSEFGGVNIAPATDACDADDRDWGYTTATDPEDLLRRIESLCMAVVKGGHCCGFVYTQLTDIEQEVNGLYSFDRREKIDASRVKAIFEAVAKVYFDSLENL